MRDRQFFLNKAFTAVSVLGALLVLTEAVLQSTGSSICATEGCSIIAASARFGDLSILGIGLALFSLLAVLSFLNRSGTSPGADRMTGVVLVVSLASEGFFTGYQAFRMSAVCLFCLAVFSLVVVLALLRLADGKKEAVAGFASLFAVFSLFYLVLPAQTIPRLPDSGDVVLFSSDECKYCSQVKSLLEEKNISAQHVSVSGYSAVLNSLGIRHVPTLFVNRGSEKFFLTGKDAIQQYLNEQAGARQKKSGISDLFGGRNTGFQSPVPAGDEGACRETIPCN